MAMDNSYTAEYEAPPSSYSVSSSDNLVSQQPPPPTYHHHVQTPTQTFVYNSKPQRNCCAICCQIIFGICGCLLLLVGAYVFVMMGLTLSEMPDSPLFDANGNANATFNDWESTAYTTTIDTYNTPFSMTQNTYSNRPFHLEIHTEDISTQQISSLRLCFDPSQTSQYVEAYAQLVVPYDLYESVSAVQIPRCPSGGVNEVAGLSLCSNATIFVGVNTTAGAPATAQRFQLQAVLVDCDPYMEECNCNYLMVYPFAFLVLILSILGPALFIAFVCCCMTCCGGTCCIAGGCCCGCAGFTALVSKPTATRPEYQTLL